MVELFFVACLVTAPDHCQEKSLPIMDERATVMGCVMTAQPQLARWTEGHPDWLVTRWNCRPAGSGGRDI